MGVAALISLEEYLATHYRPDCDYVDGELLERNVGERQHSFAQKRLINVLQRFEIALGVSVWPEMRLQVSPTRFRVPDVCVYREADPQGSVFREPPFLAIEILSPEDRMSRMQEKLEDYFAFGVEWVWIVDPLRRTATACSEGASHPVRGGILRTENPAIEVRIEDLWTSAARDC